MKKSLIPILVAGLFYSCNPPSDSGPNAGIKGTWSWHKAEFSSPDTSYAWNDVSGQLMFTDKYYSIIYVFKSGDRDRVRPVPFDSLSIDELKNSIGLVTANSGTYTIEQDSIVFMRNVALWPNAMAKDNQRLATHMPVRITPDTLYWASDGNKFVWVRRK